jgi:hypothetical protein
MAMFLCKSHPDFHIPADVEVGADFDADAYVRKHREAGADAVVFFGKCHYGHCYYDTTVGHRHPRLKMDMLGAIAASARRQGLGIIAYYSVFLDTAAATAHPDWMLQATRAGTDAGFDSGNFRPICVNSPYLEKLLIPQARELITGYDIDELFYDTMTGFNPCYCPNCRRGFGRDIPAGPDDPQWLDYVRWYAGRYDAFFTRAAQAIADVRPSVGVIFNWEWGIRRPTTPPPHITRLAADWKPASNDITANVRYFAGTGLPGDFMTGRFLHGLGDWESNTPETLRLAAAISVANGSSFYIIDRQLPDGTLEPRAWEAMGDVFGFVQERRDILVDAHHVPEVAILNSFDHIMGPDLRYFPESKVRDQRAQACDGAVRLLTEHARHFTTLGAERLLARLAEYALVIVPEQEFLAPPLLAALADYVTGGGRLLLTQSSDPAAVDPAVLALAGVRYEGPTDLDYGYLQGQAPILFRGRSTRIRPVDAQPFCPAILPLATAAKFGHGFAPPTVPSPFPGATLRTLGRGQILYVAAPVFKAYQNYQNPHLARLVLGWIDALLPKPLARVTTPAQVELSLMRRADDLVIHLINHSGRERLGGYWYPCTEYIPEIHQIQLALRLSGSADAAPTLLSIPARQTLAYQTTDSYATLTLAPLHIWQSILVPEYFAN